MTTLYTLANSTYVQLASAGITCLALLVPFIRWVRSFESLSEEERIAKRRKREERDLERARAKEKVRLPRGVRRQMRRELAAIDQARAIPPSQRFAAAVRKADPGARVYDPRTGRMEPT